MPTYDYRCRACGEITEVVHAMTADGPTVCGRCGGELQRMLYPAGIIFRGSGFYRTDSRSGSTVTGDAAAKPAKPATESGSSSGASATGPSGGGD